jgi:hypothetical protein
MPTFDPISQAALLAAVLLLVTLLWVRVRQTSARREPPADDLDTVQAWPPQVVRVMTLPERQAYDLLRKALPRNYVVLAQVPLARFISVPTRNPHQEWLRRVGRMSVDLLVCDSSSRVIAAIEVRSPDETERSRSRHMRMTRVLQSAGVVIHVWLSDRLPGAVEVRNLFMPKSAQVEAEPEVDQTGRARLPVPEIEELLSDGDRTVYGPEGEPVPSGFFDDLDALSGARR